jgi:PKD repeat protein
MKKIKLICTFSLNILFSILFNFLFGQPNSISGLQLWLKADEGVVYDLMNRVSAWSDASGNGLIFSQNDTNQQPLYISNIDSLNSMPAIIFKNDKLICLQEITIRSIFLIFNFNHDLFNDFNGLFTRQYVVDGTTDFLLVAAPSTTFFYPSILENNIYINDINTNNYAPLKRPKILYGFLNSSASWDDACIGSDRGLGRFWDGNVYEIIIYDRILEPNEILQVKRYLMDKYAPPVKLPYDTTLYSYCPFTIKPKGYFTSYQWSTGSTSDSILVVNDGVYSVTATDIFGRVSTDSIRVYFMSPALPTDTFFCYGDGDSIYLQSSLPDSIFSFFWSTGDTTPNITIHSPGEYSLTITDISGCSKIFNTSVVEDSFAIQVGLGVDTSLCKHDYLSLHNVSEIDSIIWSNGSTNDRISIDSSGEYWVYAINNHGCEVRDTINITIKGERPHIIPHYSAACDGSPLQLTDYSMAIPPDQIASSSWIIGSDTITAPNIYYTFANAGDHNVYLKVVTDSLCWADTTFTVHVYANPVADFTPYEGCQHDTIHFTSLSFSTEGTITSYQWRIAGNTYLGAEIYKSFADTGKYNIFHYVSTEHGCYDSINREVLIKTSPIVDFEYTNHCQGDIIIFNSNVEHPPYYSVINTWWAFGDGASSTIANPSHIYSSAGSYEVNFGAKLINGCENTVTRLVDVYPKPIAGFAYDTICMNKPVIFTDTTAYSTSSIWDINSDFFYGKNVGYLFTDTGIYEVYLFSTNEYGCSDTIIKEVMVHSVPFAMMNIDPEYGNPPLNVNFSTNSIGTNYFWDFGDMNTGSGTNLFHTYTSEGVYNVYLVVSNEYTCSDTAYGTVYLLPSVLDLQILTIDFIDSLSFWQPQLMIYNNSTRPVKKMQIDFGFDNFNEFVYFWNYTLQIGQIERLKLPLLLNRNEKLSSFCVKINAIDVLDQKDANEDDNFLCTSLSNTLYIMKLFNDENYLNLWINTPSEGQISCKVINIMGKTLFHSDIVDASVGMNKYKIPITNLAPGIYVLQIFYNGKILTRLFNL